MATPVEGAPVRGLSQEALVARTVALFRAATGCGEDAVTTGSFRGDSWVRLPADALVPTLRLLRDDAETRFELLLDVTCVHFPKRPAPLGAFDAVYHVLSITHGHRLRLKTACPDPDVGVPSVAELYESANLLEREAFDMFGVRFVGHPDLRRVLMPEGYVGHPLRKDFPYRGH